MRKGVLRGILFFLYLVSAVLVKGAVVSPSNVTAIKTGGDNLPTTLRLTERARDWRNAYKNRNGCRGSIFSIKTKRNGAKATGIRAILSSKCAGGIPGVKPDPYGWEEFKESFTPEEIGTGTPPWSRCHIIATSLGGDGRVPENLFPCYQDDVNNKVMRRYERWTKTNLTADRNAFVDYNVNLVYGEKEQKWPTSVNIRARKYKSASDKKSDGKDLFRVKFPNELKVGFDDVEDLSSSSDEESDADAGSEDDDIDEEYKDSPSRVRFLD